jgi:hypothetical protein
MSLVIPTSRKQLEQVATAVMTGIHDIFPTNITDCNNLILTPEQKLLNGERQYSLYIMKLLGFDFDGQDYVAGRGKKGNIPCHFTHVDPGWHS